MSMNLDKEIYIKGMLDLASLSIIFNDSPVVKRSLKKMANNEELLEVRVRPLRYNRSDAQNRYYWGVCVVHIMVHLEKTQGHKFGRDEVHQLNLKYVCGDCLVPVEIPDPINGGTAIYYKEITKSTSKMNTLEFANFIDELRGFWGQAGCDIPEPEQDKNSNFLEDLDLANNLMDD